MSTMIAEMLFGTSGPQDYTISRDEITGGLAHTVAFMMDKTQERGSQQAAALTGHAVTTILASGNDDEPSPLNLALARMMLTMFFDGLLHDPT